jgi:diguanylate cyclase (GGDEF)-like protein
MGEPVRQEDSEKGLEGRILIHPAFQHARDLASSQPDEFRAAMATIESGYNALEQELEKERQAKRGLQNEVERLQRLAIIDGLTGAYNRRYFMEQIETEVRESNRYHNPISLMIIDIDHFKRFNDTQGHQAGDYVLKCLTEIATDVLRETDIFARYGGEEFAVIMPNTNEKQAEEAAERLRQAVESADLHYKDQKLNVTVSIGVASHKTESADDFITKADQPLYAAKDLGRNCVVSRSYAEDELGVDLSQYSSEKS